MTTEQTATPDSASDGRSSGEVPGSVAELEAILGSLAPMEVGARLDGVRSRLDGAGCDALLVTSLVNIRYLTGFTGSAALLLVSGDEVLFVTDGRYRQQCAEELAASGVSARIEVPDTGEGQQEAIRDAASALANVGVEAQHVSWAKARSFESTWLPDAEVVPTQDLVEELRLVKDLGEVARIEAACAVADLALARVRHRLLEGPTEAEFALELDTEMRRLGADDLSFETIVAAGPNGAKPHARPSARVIAEGDLVVCDFGAMVDGYHSDMTRTFWVGEPTAEQRRMYEVVRDAQQAGVDAVAAGVAVADVDGACRTPIGEAGWAEAFMHSTGHGVGLDIHEAPRVAGSVDATLAAGYVVTVEPGVYLPAHGGVRIEDTVVVTDGGCRRLTNTERLPEP